MRVICLKSNISIFKEREVYETEPVNSSYFRYDDATYTYRGANLRFSKLMESREDLINGEMYEHINGNVVLYKDNKFQNLIGTNTDKDRNYISYGNQDWTISDLFPATNRMRKWLKACMRAGKLVEDPSLEPDYGYVVSLTDDAVVISNFDRGCIAKVVSPGIIVLLDAKDPTQWHCGKSNIDVKWFQTLEEAEVFSKHITGDTITPEDGEWYYIKRVPNQNQDALVCYKGVPSYGFNHGGKWTTGYIFNDKKYSRLTLATKEEVVKRLMSEARERYPKGTKYKSAHADAIDTVSTLSYNYGTVGGGIYSIDYMTTSSRNHACYVYYAGKWADIIPEEKPIRPCPYQIGDYVVNVGGDYWNSTLSKDDGTADEWVGKVRNKKYVPKDTWWAFGIEVLTGPSKGSYVGKDNTHLRKAMAGEIYNLSDQVVNIPCPDLTTGTANVATTNSKPRIPKPKTRTSAPIVAKRKIPKIYKPKTN